MELENINSDIMDRVISETNNYDYNSFTDEDIKEALNKDYLSLISFQLFPPSSSPVVPT